MEFPQYRISMQTIWDKLFYLAEATQPDVQPRVVQALTAERLRTKLRSPTKWFTTAQPSIARVWDVLLAGKDNFAIDRDQAGKLLSIFPRAAELARESRQFQARAVTYVAGCGIRQFLDLGCGLPTAPNTHETAQDVRPEALVVYADNDEQVLTHAESILAKATGVLPIGADLACPEEMLYDWRVRQHLDFYQPMCLILAMTLHFFDAETAHTLVSRYVAGLPYGSYLIVSVGQLEGEMGVEFSKQYSAGRLHHHNRETVTSLLESLQLVEPGITEARAWRAPTLIPDQGRRGHIWAARRPKGGQPQMMTPPWTLESLAYHWGDAYLFCYTRDRWVALRKTTMPSSRPTP